MAETYAEHKRKRAKRSREKSAEGREVGPLPGVVDADRRNRGLDSLEAFALEYFPERFYLAFSAAHRAAIGHLERATNAGGLLCVAMPRGSGKDTLAEVSVLRAVLCGLRRYVVLVSATERHATRSLKKIKAELETNDRLLADFPEVCHPIRALERIAGRAKGQTLDSKPTRIEWTADTIILPTVPGSASSGGVIQVAGLTGAIRGLTVAGPDGRQLRPDMVVLNDCQTRESAKSPTQTTDRESVVTDDVLMLAGPDTTIAAAMLCTVIYPGNLSARFLDPDKHAEWQSVRTKMLERFPSNMALWDEYAEMRRESLRAGDEGRRATEFYAANRAAMDAGAVVTWPDRKKADELSGLQSAMNIFIDNPRGFHAECQNDPQANALASGAKELNADAVASRLSGHDRFTVPNDAAYLTAFIDCGKYLHWYAVCAWTPAFGGCVVDYGCWPRQGRGTFQASDARPSLSDVYKGMTDAQLVFAGLRDLSAEILGRKWYRENGAEMPIDRCLVDSGYEKLSVYQFARQSPHRGLIYPSKGIGRTTTAAGVAAWKPRPGERSGWHWRLTAGEGTEGRGVRVVQFDSDLWKSFLHGRLTVPPGGAWLSFYGRSAAAHALIGEHCAAEYAEPVTIRGDTFDKWTLHVTRPDNHLLDCLTGACVAASVAGATFTTATDAGGVAVPVEKKAGPKLKLSELLARKRRERVGSFR